MANKKMNLKNSFLNFKRTRIGVIVGGPRSGQIENPAKHKKFVKHLFSLRDRY